MISDRLKSILSESSRVELIMENLGVLKGYPQDMVKQLLMRRKDIGPDSGLTLDKYKSAADAERAVKGDSRAAFAIVPPGEPTLAILTPDAGSAYPKQKYTVITNPSNRIGMSDATRSKVADFLYGGQMTDILGFFRALTRAYGPSWELHLIRVDQQRVALRSARVEAKKGVDAFARKDHGRAPYGNWSKKDLMDRLDAYKTGKSPNVKSAADILKLIASSGSKLPTKFKFNGLNFDLGSSRIQFDERKGTLYGGMGGENGLEYRADWNEYYQALKGVPDENAKDLAQTLPKYIFVEYKLNGGVVGPASVKFKS